MENKENEEYRKRIRDLVDRVEKDKDTDTPEVYQRLLEAIERTKKTAVSKIDPTYRNERSIIGFVYIIREYYMLRADPKYPTEKDQFQEEIDLLYKLVYEELKKTNPFLSQYSPNERNSLDKAYKRRMLSDITKILGAKNVNNDFYKKYNLNELVRSNRSDRSIRSDSSKTMRFVCYMIVFFTIAIILSIMFP